MMSTIREIFDIAIAAEQAAQQIYRGFMKKFGHVAAAAGLWQDLLNDEIYHEQELKRIFGRISQDQPLSDDETELLAKAKHEVETISVEALLKSVATLDDAYEIAYALEHSEVNAVFGFLVRRHTSSEDQYAFVMSLIGEHIARLEHFSKTVGDSTWRQGIMASDQQVSPPAH